MAKSQQTRQRALSALDRQLLVLLDQRADMVRDLAEAGGKVDAQQDELQRRELLANYAGALPAEQINAVWREIQSASRSVVKNIRVAYLGPAHSYSHLATLERFGAGASLAPVAGIGTVFEEVKAGRVDFGVAPIENSTDGRIVDTLSMLARNPVPISGEIQLRIHHCLLSRAQREDVGEVYSKPQALSQCRDWLAANLPNAKLKEVASTALAAQMAAKKKGGAAIASRQAGVFYGLDVIAPNIEDNPDNITRFAILGGAPLTPTGCDKTTLMFQLPHQSGALADAMAVFKRKQLNLTWIESFPMAGAPNEYVFFVELEGHQDEPDCRSAVQLLKKKTEKLEVLGSYPRSLTLE